MKSNKKGLITKECIVTDAHLHFVCKRAHTSVHISNKTF